MSWFHRLTGFHEADYASTRARLQVESQHLLSRVNGARHRIGRLETPSLGELRHRAAQHRSGERTTFGAITGDARRLHADPRFAGALFQVASQFNLLEMIHPGITPEDGVTRYEGDGTQGPACAIAAGAATIYRNYFAPVGGTPGQTAQRQIDTLSGIGEALSQALDRPVSSLWSMKNGYALCRRDGLAAIASHLRSLDPDGLDALRSRLAIGLHWDVDVTDVEADERPRVSQAFCSALPIAYSGLHDLSHDSWEPFARLILDACYEATLLAACDSVARGGSRTVLLTRVGGGVFGNRRPWIDAAIEHALGRVEHAGLDVRLVCFNGVDTDAEQLIRGWSRFFTAENR